MNSPYSGVWFAPAGSAPEIDEKHNPGFQAGTKTGKKDPKTGEKRHNMDS